MSPFEVIKERKEHKISQQVEEKALPIAVSLVDSIGNHEPSYPYNIGGKPRSLSGEEYARRIAERVQLRLARVGLDEVISYDPVATMVASTEYAQTPGSGWRWDIKDEMKIVFKQHPSPAV